MDLGKEFLPVGTLSGAGFKGGEVRMAFGLSLLT